MRLLALAVAGLSAHAAVNARLLRVPTARTTDRRVSVLLPLRDEAARVEPCLRALLAPSRAERPDAFVARRPEADPDARERCPFCEGREDRTPPEVWANRPGGGAHDSPGWLQRSVPNLYPALAPPEGQPRSDDPAESGLSSAAGQRRSVSTS